jgi:hypothetical protein
VREIKEIKENKNIFSIDQFYNLENFEGIFREKNNLFSHKIIFAGKTFDKNIVIRIGNKYFTDFTFDKNKLIRINVNKIFIFA